MTTIANPNTPNNNRHLTRYQQFKARYQGIVPVFTAGAGLFSDGYLNGVISDVNVCLSSLYPTEYATSSARQNVSSIVFAGTILGQLAFGYVSDRFGRKIGLVICCCGLILFSALSAGSWGANGSIYGLFAALTAYRFFLGIFIGGEYPSGSVACAEGTVETPSGGRNFLFILFTNFSIDFGFVVSAFVPLVLLWIFGPNQLNIVWRFSLALGCIPPMSIFYLRLKFKEPKQFRQNALRKTKTPWWLIIKFYWWRLFCVSLIWFVYDFSAYSQNVFSGSILEIIIPNGDLYQVFGWNVVINLFYLPGSAIGAYISDKLGPNRTLALFIFLQSIVGFILAGVYQKLLNYVAGFTVMYGLYLSLGEAGAGNNIGLLASKTSASAIRSRYYGIAAATGKVGAFVGTYVFPLLIANASSPTASLQNPVWVSSSLGLLAGALALFGLPNIGQDCIQEEDERFRVYLLNNGFDISKMGVPELEGDEPISPVSNSNNADAVEQSKY